MPGLYDPAEYVEPPAQGYVPRSMWPDGPKLVPVEHDPFEARLIPVDHDPFQPVEPGAAGERMLPRYELAPMSAAEASAATGGQRVIPIPRGTAEDAARQLYGMTGIPDIQEGMAALGRGEALPGLGQAAVGLGSLGAVAAPVARGAMALGREAVGAIPGVMADTTGAIRAFHASPYDFDTFDISKVGTGQGAASYGHGLYAAENPRVSGPGGQYDREFTAKNMGKPDLNQLDDFILQNIRSGKSDMDIMQELAKNHSYLSFDEAYKALQDVHSNKAKIYEADINAEPNKFLDWDKPASAQPENVKAALNQLWESRGGSLEGREYPPFAAHNEATGQSLYAALATSFGGPGQASQALREAGVPGIRYQDQGSRLALPKWSIDKEPLNYYPISDDPIVRGLRGALSHLQRGGGARSIDEGIDELRSMGTPAGTSAADLLEANRHRVSVDAPPATRNYVVFDDKLIDIIRKYGIAGLIAGGAASIPGQAGAMTHLVPVEHDPFQGASP